MGTNLCMPTPLPLESHFLQFSLALSTLHSSLPGLLEVLGICQSLTHLRYYSGYPFCLQPSTLDFCPFIVASPSPPHLFSHANLPVTSFLAALFFKKNTLLCICLFIFACTTLHVSTPYPLVPALFFSPWHLSPFDILCSKGLTQKHWVAQMCTFHKSFGSHLTP